MLVEPGEAGAIRGGDADLHRLHAGGQARIDGAGGAPRAPPPSAPRPQPRRGRGAPPARCAEQVGLVQHLDHPVPPSPGRAGLGPSAISAITHEHVGALGALSGCAMSRTCRMMSAAATSSSVARKASTSCRQVGDKPTVSDRMQVRPVRQADGPQGGSSVAKSWSCAIDAGAGQRVEQGGLAGIGVADQRDHR